MRYHHPIVTMGLAYRRYGDTPFGSTLPDRLLHTYVIGQTGTGKSTLLHNLAVQDARHGTGLCLIDPHGDLAHQLAARVEPAPIYWDVADPSSPYGYNPLTRVSAALRPVVVSGLIDALKKQWADAWGARMEHLLRYALLALLEIPEADLRDVLRLYLDKDYRRSVLSYVTDEQTRTFWLTEYARLNYAKSVDGVAPIANKLGALLAHPVVRNALCTPAEPLRFRRLMDNGQTVIINLAKGRLGVDVANVVGGLLVASILHAALSRQDTPPAQRLPFMLYVDEFHSFTTAAFCSLLAEVRKYGLGVTAASQYIGQSDQAVFEAIMGNVGTLVVFRVGALDAPVMARQLGDVAVADLVRLPNYRAFVQLMVRGQKTPTLLSLRGRVTLKFQEFYLSCARNVCCRGSGSLEI